MKTLEKVKTLKFIVIVNSELHQKLKTICRPKGCYFASSFPFPHTTHSPEELVVNQSLCYRKVSQVRVHMTLSQVPTDIAQRSIQRRQ